jgi:hypothetical protein
VHFFDRVGHDRRRRSAPTGVYSGDGTTARIEQQNREAIGCPDADAAAWIVCHERIAFLLAVSQSMGVPDLSGMNLTQRDVRRRIAQPSAEAVALPKKMLELGATVDTIGAE